MKSAFFIMKLVANPKDGYKTYDGAKGGLQDLYEKGDWEVRKSGSYTFMISELFWFDVYGGLPSVV